jgi:hypothetical protein
MPETEWYYCLTHKAVETKDGCRAIDRFGPYPTREDAAQALQKVEERNEEWDAQDEEWEEDTQQ